LITDNSKIGPWDRDLLGVQFKNHFISFLAFQLPSPRRDLKCGEDPYDALSLKVIFRKRAL